MRNCFFRPSRPFSCRKRRLCQGQARPGRFACLDIRRLASGQKRLRAKDGNTSGGGSKQKYPFFLFSDRMPVCFPAASFAVSDQGARLFATGIFFVVGRRVFCFASEPFLFLVWIFSVFRHWRECFCDRALRCFPAALLFFADRLGVLQVPPLFLAGWEPYYIRLHPAKGLAALWTPGAFGASLLTLLKRAKA